MNFSNIPTITTMRELREAMGTLTPIKAKMRMKDSITGEHPRNLLFFWQMVWSDWRAGDSDAELVERYAESHAKLEGHGKPADRQRFGDILSHMSPEQRVAALRRMEWGVVAHSIYGGRLDG